ncbi:MAG: Electron transport complex subunit RsxB [Firmicutes bacterium]|nr:Electron transport complex subunit RsxB [candidate division NPL-UPA2 bacterium]
MSRVAVTRTSSYAPEEVEQALARALQLIYPDGLQQLIRPGFKVALKVNMLMGKSPERAITTHPAVVHAVCKLVSACGGIPLIIDSPGGPYTPAMLKLAYERCGFAAVARETGALLNFDTSVQRVNGALSAPHTSAKLLAPAIAADVLINLPKLKTHGLTVMTCAVKNMFGLIPGLAKIDYHMRMPEVRDFCAALVGIAELAQPELTIVDAVEIMEGEGPSGGKPKFMGYVLAGENMHTVDMVAAAILGLRPEQVPTLAAAQATNPPLAPLRSEDVSVVGAPLSPHNVSLPLTARNTNLFEKILPRQVAKALARNLRPRLRFVKAKCTSCGICVRSCPPKALTARKNDVPALNSALCIRCFCCQELCPEHAVEIKRTLLARVLTRY